MLCIENKVSILYYTVHSQKTSETTKNTQEMPQDSNMIFNVKDKKT